MSDGDHGLPAKPGRTFRAARSLGVKGFKHAILEYATSACDHFDLMTLEKE